MAFGLQGRMHYRTGIFRNDQPDVFPAPHPIVEIGGRLACRPLPDCNIGD
ncbi:MAG: hypothetical protein N838_12295 [Thiohalocapsa sp. PB-PSB1]|nr:MAG: hypothetical protein N838_12295 [Thiohalocapsa sp. PB-PSB1]